MDTAAEHRAILEAAAQNIVRLDVRARNPADAIVADKLVNLVTPELVGSSTIKMAVAHRPRMLVAMLHVAFVKVDRIRIQAARRACFKAAQADAVFRKAFRKFVCTRFAHSPTDARFKPGEHLGKA